MQFRTRLQALSCGLALLLASCGGSDQDPVAAAKAANEKRIEEADVTQRQKRDAEFLVDAASRGLYLVKLSQLVQQKASQPAMQAFAQSLARDQTNANAALRVLAEQKERELPNGLSQDQQQTFDKLQKLTGPEFDGELLQAAAKTLDDSVDDFEQMTEKAYDGDIRAFAAKYAPLLQQQYEQAKQLEDHTQP